LFNSNDNLINTRSGWVQALTSLGATVLEKGKKEAGDKAFLEAYQAN
jgi:hypothetical protein